jgi:acyl-homoserine-lactone acylase
LLALVLGGCVPRGSTAVAGDVGEVEVLWDQWQVPHVYAQSRVGIAYGLGYAQLRAYPDEILELYAHGRGEAAATLGRDALRSDRLVRTLGIPTLAREAFAKLAPDVRAELEAFARGMNDFAAEHPERVSTRVRDILPVRPEDALAHGQRVLLAFTLLTGARPMLLGVDGDVPPVVAGSNAWAIGPSRSASGHPLLLANPHLPWDPPALRFFEAHLVGPDAPLYGCMLLGFPGISIGFNDAIAWTHTVNVIDTADLFAIVPDGDGYRWDGKRRAYDEHTEAVRVRGDDGAITEEPLSIRRSVHGPVVDLADGRRVAVRTGLDTSVGGWLTAWTELGRARDLPTFERALAKMDLPMFTVVYADRDGHILYVSAGRVPERAHREKGWFEPVPGDTSATLWSEIVPYTSLPRVVDPAAGFVQNANSVPWFATMPPLDPIPFARIGIPPGPLSTREIHSLRLLTGDESITFDELRTMQRSSRLELADHVLPDLLAAAKADPTLTDAVALLDTWDRQASSSGAVLFEAWADRALPKLAFVEPWSAANPLDTPRGITDKAAAVAALVEAVAQVKTRWGRLDPAWGEVHRLRKDVPGVGASGDLGTFHVIDYAPTDDGGTRPVAGDTFVALVELRPEGPHAQVLLTYGNASPHAPFAKDQLELLSQGQLRAPLLQRAEIEAGAIDTLRVP